MWPATLLLRIKSNSKKPRGPTIWMRVLVATVVTGSKLIEELV